MSAPLLPYEDALRIVLDHCTPLAHERVAPAVALGRVLAEAVIAEADLPPFDNSAMDGFAMAGGDGDVAAGTELEVGGEQAAGDGMAEACAGAWAIMTGAPLPRGMDRVIPVEHTHALASDAEGQATRIRLDAAVGPDRNVRHAGSDVRRGDTVLAAGTLVAPHHLMLLVALGVATLPVIARPRVALICTGRELVDDPAAALAPGQIRNSNGPFLAARLRAAGAEVVHVETVSDDVEAFEAALRRALDAGARVLLSTGAVSMGRYDFVPQSLQRLGARTLFHKVAIRPGKPLLFARLPEGALLFGLPGNPISGAVGLRFFVEPALRAMGDLAAERPLRAPLAESLAEGPPLRRHLKSRLVAGADGRLVVQVLDGQQSYRIRPLAQADCWTVLPADAGALPAGALVDVYAPGHLDSLLPGSPS